MPSILGVCVWYSGVYGEVWDVVLFSCPVGEKSDLVWLVQF